MLSSEPVEVVPGKFRGCHYSGKQVTLISQVSSLGRVWRVQAKELLDLLEGLLSSNAVELWTILGG